MAPSFDELILAELRGLRAEVAALSVIGTRALRIRLNECAAIWTGLEDSAAHPPSAAEQPSQTGPAA